MLQSQEELWDSAEDWLQSVVVFLACSVIGFAGFLASVLAYSTSLGASLVWCFCVICLMGLSGMDWNRLLEVLSESALQLHVL